MANNSDRCTSMTNKETLAQKLQRQTQNALTRTAGYVEKSDAAARAQALKVKIVDRKKTFGMEYLTLLLEQEEGENAVQQALLLQLCVDQARRDIAELEEKCNQHQFKASQKVDELKKDKLLPKPDGGDAKAPTINATTAAVATNSAADDFASTAAHDGSLDVSEDLSEDLKLKIVTGVRQERVYKK